MFTGIVEEVGEVRDLEILSDAARIQISGSKVVSDASHGDSICVSGVCLTVAELSVDGFTADVIAATLEATSLGKLKSGTRVNLERAATANTRLGGHIVTGHVDGVGAVEAIEPSEHWTRIRIGLPAELAKQLAKKGSVAVDGTSLTVGDVGVSEDGGHWFEVSLIPTTLSETTLGQAVVGDSVNLETDVLAKYVQRQLGGDTT